IKISDFGLSQVLPEGESIIRKFHGGIFGLAPEVLEYGEFSQAIDFWALGCVIYELFHKAVPFIGANGKELMENILKAKFEFTVQSTQEAKDLVMRLLEKDPKKRLCSIEEIKSHDWFVEVNWLEVFECKKSPEFCPGDSSENFAVESNDEQLALSPALSIEDFGDFIESYQDEE
ncbi:RAC serine/threonine-protein kinase, partial [Enteropsectra breve]